MPKLTRLKLTRKFGQRFWIGGRICVVALPVKLEAKIGLNGPHNVAFFLNGNAPTDWRTVLPTNHNGPGLLVLKIKAGDVVFMTGDITVQVVKVTPTRIDFYLIAPEDVAIEREEVLRSGPA